MICDAARTDLQIHCTGFSWDIGGLDAANFHTTTQPAASCWFTIQLQLKCYFSFWPGKHIYVKYIQCIYSCLERILVFTKKQGLSFLTNQMVKQKTYLLMHSSYYTHLKFQSCFCYQDNLRRWTFHIACLSSWRTNVV